jgi:hypothetical protein
LAQTPTTAKVEAVSLEFLTLPAQNPPNGNDAETFTRRSGEDWTKTLPPIGTVAFGHMTDPSDSTPAVAANRFETMV